MKFLIISIFVLLSSYTLTAQGDQPEAQWFWKPKLKVMTRNLYLGTDILKIFSFEDPREVPLLVAEGFQQVKDSNFHIRAQALAEEIDLKKPDLIGLQEVSLFRLQTPGDFLNGNSMVATDVVFDYLQILMEALEVRGLKYEVVSENKNSDVEVPMLASGAQEESRIDDLRLTNRDVILKRVGVQTRNLQESHFSTNLEGELRGIPIKIVRGYTSVIAKVRGREYKFVNVHLEIEHSLLEVQTLQALELVEALKDETKFPIILLGDFNSGPGVPSPPHFRPYDVLTANGFIDAWTRRFFFFPQSGNTCCYSADLKDPTSQLSERIDQVWVKRPHGNSHIGYVRMSVLGDHPSDRIEGLWPSDHAGVFAKFRF